MSRKKSKTYVIYILYFGLYLLIGISMLIKQPYGNPPDEYNRYLIPLYIAEHGSLPNGYDESIRISGYGFSYAFQPILPYMLQGYFMRFMKLFTEDGTALLYGARAVNLTLGLAMAWIVLLLSGQWFSDRRFGWLFAFLTTFLPQAIFVHTYVNTDSCCMFSISLILLGLTLGFQDRFSLRSCLILSAGIIFCALSYYNAYSYILSCILIFAAFFAGSDFKAFLRKGTFISALVLLGIGWWFIRSAVLYDGDFLGLRARKECAMLYASPEYRPGTRVTWQNQGYSIWEMLTESDFCLLTMLSFIGIYGPMTIITSIWVYRFYEAFFAAGLLFCVALPLSKTLTPSVLPEQRGLRIFFHINMVFCIVIPFALSLLYSYSTDYQPQGRYILPALLPLCAYAVHGLEKGCKLLLSLPLKKGGFLSRVPCCGILCSVLCLLIAGALLLTVYGYAFPYYTANPIAP